MNVAMGRIMRNKNRVRKQRRFIYIYIYIKKERFVSNIILKKGLAEISLIISVLKREKS
jgi:hypothetical protein